jgi:hypothetical protein
VIQPTGILYRPRFADRLASGQLLFRQAHIAVENIDSEFVAAQMTGEIDLLGIDIDGNDYCVFDAIRSTSARVVVIEYNSKFPPPIRWRVPYSAQYRWDGSDWFGASLQSMDDLFSAHGYGLVGCNICGADAVLRAQRSAGRRSVSCTVYGRESLSPSPLFSDSGIVPASGRASALAPSRHRRLRHRKIEGHKGKSE